MARSSRHSPSVTAVPEAPAKPSVVPLGALAKLALSAAIVWHLWGVIAEPMRFQTVASHGPSPITNAFYKPIGPYAEFMYLTHGYAFFAPQPGPSHLIEATTSGATGTQTRRYPDLARDQPRLFYHRHFMLSEFLNNLYRAAPPAGIVLNAEEREILAAESRIYRQVRESMKHHLSIRAGGAEVKLERVEHRMPGLPEFMQEGIKLDHPRLYETMREEANPTAPAGLPPPSFLFRPQ